MATNADPWRTLGLNPGASQDEIRRAYRRLAKANHPDAAGETALPRFLAIQQAYDQLAGGRARPLTGRGARPTTGAEPRDAWRADPDRARASGRADGRRAPGTRPSGGPRSDASGGPATGARPRTGPDAADGAPRTGPEAPGGRPRRSSSRRRPVNRATPGSTSYEGADEEPFEPGWSGATWYGASSGTYWTINPKEYADPRKHGPEYQARARRARSGSDSPTQPDPAEAPIVDEPSTTSTGTADPTTGPTAGAPPADAATPGPPTAPGSTSRRRPSGRPARTPDSWTFASPVDEPRSSTGDGPDDPRGDTAGSGDDTGRHPADRAVPGDRARSPRAGVPPRRPTLDDLRRTFDEPEGRVRVPLLREPTTSFGRLGMALLGWPPLGIFVGVAVDRGTGCGSYAASCGEVYAPGTWLVNAVIVLLLLAIPRVAAWSAHGTLAALVVGVPSAIALSAGGGSNVPEASGPVLLAVLAIAYLTGVAYAVARRLQLGSARPAIDRRVP